MNAFGGNVLGKLLDDCQGISGQGCASVRVIFIHEGERTVWLNAIGEVGIAARNQNQVALECAVLVDGACVVNASMKAVIRAQLCEDRPLGESFRRGSGHEEFVTVQRINHLARVQRIELDAEVGVSELRAADDFLNALCERVF